jgi:hypothetical protein
MQGYILNLNRVKDEDLVVSILSQENLETLYRFYGARHGVINLGFKVDFETEASLKSGISRLRDVVHIGFPWLRDYNKLRLWQQFIALFYPHLYHAEDTGGFYFELIDEAAHRWEKQNPKRIAVESYVKLLEHEGRLHRELECFFCEQPIEEEVSLIRAYLPAHKQCAHTLSISQEGIEELFGNHSSLFLSDKEVERLWYVLLEGL